jgi:four helix bundle protein
MGEGEWFMGNGSWFMEKEGSGSMRIERVEDMRVFQVFYEMAVAIEKVTRQFGPDFRWLRTQVLRSSESVCANMTEAFYSQYSTEYLQGLHRCRREARETLLHLRYAKDSGNLADDVHHRLEAQGEDALQQLAAVISSIERKIQERGKAKPGVSLAREEEQNYHIPHQP